MEGLSSQSVSVDYFQLLTTQLQNQDPVDPVDQEGMISNLTQFSILEGIENLNASFSQFMDLQEMSQGVSLMGKSIEFRDPASGAIRSGEATDIFNVDDNIRVLVDGTSISMSDIVRVSDA